MSSPFVFEHVPNTNIYVSAGHLNATTVTGKSSSGDLYAVSVDQKAIVLKTEVNNDEEHVVVPHPRALYKLNSKAKKCLKLIGTYNGVDYFVLTDEDIHASITHVLSSARSMVTMVRQFKNSDVVTEHSPSLESCMAEQAQQINSLINAINTLIAVQEVTHKTLETILGGFNKHDSRILKLEQKGK